MHAFQPFSIKDQSLCLSADRSIYWEQENSLIVSDLHFGKTGHFRKAGIAVPQSVFKEDIQRLLALVQYFKPSALIVVGDMFHSHANKELDLFARWRDDFADLKIQLIKGNHDILRRSWYDDTRIEISDKTLKIKSFCFQHDPGDCSDDESNEEYYVFSGHIHPGITINGMGKQSLTFPCFYFSDTYCILPAFSRFTGTVSIRPKEDDVTFAIVNNTILQVQ
ncbi:MAG: ligase-associated DNA damage response endonuclease PdeM [Chitinophagaceae bacterium]|nr:ligase-associated DNA damage response endonuclease PdeM [Chitinophagaceae bacterium]